MLRISSKFIVRIQDDNLWVSFIFAPVMERVKQKKNLFLNILIKRQ